MRYGVSTQKKIFIAGMSGQKPLIPLDYAALRQKAQNKLSPEAFAYIDGGAGRGQTMTENERGFQKFTFISPMMQASKEVNLSIELLGRSYHTPLLAAPIGVLELAHPKADAEVAQACAKTKIPMIFSNQASVDMESCAEILGSSPKWFQLYWSKSDELVESFVRRAETCGCEAIVVTLDTTSLGWRPQDLSLAFLPFLHGKGLAQYTSDPVFEQLVEDNIADGILQSGESPKRTLTTIRNFIQLCHRYPGSILNNLRSGRALAGVRTFINTYMRPELRWEDIPRLKSMTNLPILVKGVQCLSDVRLAEKAGVQGVIISNHGGRQIDGGAAAIHCLAKIASQYQGPLPLLFDSGIRSGADVLKALALGAQAVLIGRPYVYALGIAGHEGVEALFTHLLAEMELQMSLMGLSSIDQLNPSLFEH